MTHSNLFEKIEHINNINEIKIYKIIIELRGEKLNILVTINKKYKKQLIILLNSIKQSNKNENFNIYILHKDLKDEDINEIKEGLNKNFNINDIKIKENDMDFLPVNCESYPVEIYIRIFASKYLPDNIDRILYLDSDTVVINKLNELYNMNFEDNYFIAATHIGKAVHKFNEMRLGIKQDEPYINTGVLLINLKELRKINIEKDVIDFIENNEKKLMLPDQDIISSIYGDKIKLVDELKYNLGERTLRIYNINNPRNKIDLEWIYKNTVIIHYFGRNKPYDNKYIGRLGYFYYNVKKQMMQNNKKVLILSCGTGGGHNIAARAVQEDLISKGIEADFVEYLEIINPKLKDRINNIYIRSTRKNGKVFKRVYKLGEIYQKTKLKSPVYLLNGLNKKRLYKYIIDNNYGYVITTHLFAAQALTAVKKEYTDIHFMQIATDYVSIPFWEETNPDYFVIPSEKLVSSFKNKKIDENKLLPFGIPVLSNYRKKYDKQKCKMKLHLDINKKYVLVLNGSMGFGNVIDITKKLIEKIDDIVFIISCGNNEKLLKSLTSLYDDNDRIIILPYTNNLSDYMKCCEIILSKPGGLTTTEVATLRKPLIHMMPIPGCENYNAEFFSKNKMAIKSTNIDEIVKNTKKLLYNIELQKEMIKNQENCIKHDTCDKISNIIIRELCRGENNGKI